MTALVRATVGRLTAVAAVLLIVGCGGSDATPNPGLEVPKSTATMDDVKAGRNGSLKQVGSK